MKRIGVDLGTTNSCVYYLDDDGDPVLVLGDRGKKFFSSAVWAAGPGKERVVGSKAKARMGVQPPPIIAAKRKMGTDEKVLLGGEPVDAVEISTEILRHAKKLVEDVTGDTVGHVVVTMPAYFDAAPKRDTRTAAVRAFFDGDEELAEGRLELQLEPEAAAYAYTTTEQEERLKVLVYDLGGGTFDVTVMEKSPEAGLSVIKFGGDPHLGGDNIDDRLAMWILYQVRGGKPEALDRILDSDRYPSEDRCTILQQLMANDVAGLWGVLKAEDRDLLLPEPAVYDLELSSDEPEDLVRIQKLKMLAESAKMELTHQTEVAIVMQNAFSDRSGDLVNVDVELSRPEFNLLIGDMIEKSLRETMAVVSRSGWSAADFDRVLLVGGSSRMPVVAEELRKIFCCPVKLEDPDLIVARGAAMLAGSLRGGDDVAGGRLTLDYPRQTSDASINIIGKLTDALADGQVYLIPEEGDEQTAAVDGDGFLLRGVPLRADCENRFHLEVLDGAEKEVAEADVVVLHRPGAVPQRAIAKFTKAIRYLGKSGYRVLFDEGEPLPASKTEICYRASRDSFICIPIYEGERFLRDLRIENIDPSLNIGAEIRLQIHVDKDFKVTASAEVVSTKENADVEFQIEPIKMPSIEEMSEEKEKVLEEIENALEAVRDVNKQAKFRRSIRRLEGDFIKAAKAAEPDSHHLFSIIGELRKLKVEIESCLNFLSPPKEEFDGMIRVCRNLAGKLKDTSTLKKEDVLRKVDGLDRAGKDAWEHENQQEWAQIAEEAAQLVEQIKSELRGDGGGPDINSIPPEVIRRDVLTWLGELQGEVKEQGLDKGFEDEIEETRDRVRAVDLRDADEGRAALLDIVEYTVKPLDKRIKKAIKDAKEKPDMGGLVDSQKR